jgi:hypothetical protein
VERAYHLISSIPLAKLKQSQLGLKLRFSQDYRHFCHFRPKFSGPGPVNALALAINERLDGKDLVVSCAGLVHFTSGALSPLMV